ncbi:hypothetical protein XA68_10827 [Ophiocordyceps unilateralis]|uniref:Protein-arginine deiminase C-terminal domain-containing protein n=1 Tax=Ophiocordyceps unilateralis TaxID=268505 RepID=A0A2A9PI03_OPHUN|nr:hypothetical protein XA68_10827 [Ophiocordyceps unilateralis]
MWNPIASSAVLIGHVALTRGAPFDVTGVSSTIFNDLNNPRIRNSSDTLLTVTILADTNRDGVVDTEGDSDYTRRRTWTSDSGALFLANIVDTGRRCSLKIQKSTPNEELEYCHDATDNVLRNAKFLAPVRTLPVVTPALSDKATGSITVMGKMAATKTRIFQKRGADWVYISSSHIFSAEELRAGLELGIDARDVRRPGGWDGKAMVQFTVKETGVVKAIDWVQMRVAPVLIHNHLQKAEALFVQSAFMMNTHKNETAMRFNSAQAKFVRDIDTIAREAGLPLFQFNDITNHDIWVQDFFEPGYMTIPGPDGPVGLRIMIRSAQRDRLGGRQVFQTLRSDTIGAVQHLVWGDTSDSMGNLETIPPYVHNGKRYPAGRAVMGSQAGIRPFIMEFLRAQEEQDPIELDTTWLFIGHADEFMQFLPHDSERGWVLVVSDPQAGIKLLQDATLVGHGGSNSHSRPIYPTDKESCFPASTIEDSLFIPHMSFIQDYCAKAIEQNIDIIKRETGITNKDIIRIPALFYVSDFENNMTAFHYHCRKSTASDDERDTVRGSSTPPRLVKKAIIPPYPDFKIPDERAAGTPLKSHGGQWTGPTLAAWQKKRKEEEAAERGKGKEEEDEGKEEEDKGLTYETLERLKSALPVGSFYPGSINSIVLSNSTVIAPNPWGPLVDGKDIFAEAVTAAYAKANYTVHFVDDWFSHFIGGGDIHCATNTLRDIKVSWL